MKKIICLIAVIAMIFVMGTVAFAEESYAKVGDIICADAAEMYNTLKNASGDVTVEIYGKIVTTGAGVTNPNISKLSFVGKTEDAEICVDGTGYVDFRGTNYPIEYTDLVLNHINGGLGIDGRLHLYFSTYSAGNVTYTRCSFPNTVIAMGSQKGTVVTFNDCVFNNTASGNYSLWIEGNATNVVVNGGTFCGVRGIKLYTDGTTDFSSVTVNGATFEDTITEKHAVVLTRGESVVLEGNTFNNAKGIIEIDDACKADIDGKKVTIDEIDYLVDGENQKLEEIKYAAEVGGEKYVDFSEALKKITETNNTIKLLDNVTVSEAWDCRYNGAKILVPVTIEGNGKTLKITGKIDDKNWNTVFRFEEDATVKNLTIDVSEATGVDRGISSKKNIVVDNCEFIGNGIGRFAVIFGEGAGTDIGSVTATISNSDFTDWKWGVSDNQNAQDAKKVSVIGNTFENAGAVVSASESVTFTGNEFKGGRAVITYYNASSELSVTATGNKLDSEYAGYNTIKAITIEADDDFTILVCEYYSADGKLVDKHDWDEGKITQYPTYTAKGAKTYTCTKGGVEHFKIEEIPVLVAADEENGTFDVIEGDDGTEYIVDYQEGVVFVPENLPEEVKDEYETPEDIISAFEVKVSEGDLDQEKVETTVFEVTVGYFEKDVFVPATEEFFKENKTLKITLPYPEGADRNDKFEIYHLNAKTGEIDKYSTEVYGFYRITRTLKGLVIEVNSLSPFAIAFESVENVPSSGKLPGIVGGKPVTIIDGLPKEENESNPNTGAPAVSVVPVLVAAAAVFFKKR